MSKKKSKKTKVPKLITVIILLIMLTVAFFFDKDTYNELKSAIIKGLEDFDIEEKINVGTTKPKPEVKKEQVEKIELTDDLMVFFLNVGQADSILIKSQNEFMLIDAGNNSDGKKLVDYFNELGITEFKYVVGTHAHEDHIGGMDDIIKNFKIKNFYMPDATTPTQTFMDVLDALENKKVAFKTPKVGTTLSLGESKLDVIYVGKEKEDLNDTSIVLKLTYQDTSFLFTGDATSNVEREILNKNIESTLLKVGHHGSKYSSTATFLSKVKPSYAIISCEKGNDYGHPHDVVVNKLNKMNTEILRTDELGTIIALSNGKEITFKNIKTNVNGG